MAIVNNAQDPNFSTYIYLVNLTDELTYRLHVVSNSWNSYFATDQFNDDQKL